eukprot:12911796-Alexandrium_andersonii.AAC.1
MFQVSTTAPTRVPLAAPTVLAFYRRSGAAAIETAPNGRGVELHGFFFPKISGAVRRVRQSVRCFDHRPTRMPLAAPAALA